VIGSTRIHRHPGVPPGVPHRAGHR